MTLRELCDVVGIDDDPLGCGFAIVAVLRSAVQGEPSTYEGECASLLKASELFDVNDPQGIRLWLDALGEFTTINLPEKWLLNVFRDDEVSSE